LEPLYRMSESWDKLITVQQVQLQHQEDADERIAMMHRIAEIAEDRAGDHQLAFEWMQRALLEAPAHEHTASEVERLAAMLDRWDQLASTYADVLEAALFILKSAPTDGDALENLDRIYTEQGAHEALAAVLKQRIAAAGDGDPEKVDLSYRLAQVLENELGRIDEAVTVYQGVLEGL